jgi:SET domain-containing protein
MRKFKPGEHKLKVARSKTGLGLFTHTPIKRGSCIIEYRGRVLKKGEEFTSRSKYLFEINKNKTIDGGVRTNTARYINHACYPNCEIEIFKSKVFVMAKKNIKPGEELNYDYDTEYFEEYIEPKGCKCLSCTK